MLRYLIALAALATSAVLAQAPVVRTADPIRRGLAQSKAGNRTKAREALDAALKLKPDFKEAQAARVNN